MSKIKIAELFYSIQGEGRGPIRDRAQRGAGAQRSALCDLGVVPGAVVMSLPSADS